MATWIKTTVKEFVVLADLEMATHFSHDTKQKKVHIFLNGEVLLIEQASSPSAYNKVLDYLKQIELQIK